MLSYLLVDNEEFKRMPQLITENEVLNRFKQHSFMTERLNYQIFSFYDE